MKIEYKGYTYREQTPRQGKFAGKMLKSTQDAEAYIRDQYETGLITLDELNKGLITMKYEFGV